MFNEEYNRIVVGVADMYISDNPRDRIITFSLGSCMGVTMYDPELRVGGMIHCMLPTAKLDVDKAAARPEMFVDTGLLLMLQRLFDIGARRKRMIVKLAGAASVLNDNEFFRVGERNCQYARKFFEKNMMPVEAEDVLGTVSRTMTLYMDSGVTTVRTAGQEKEL